MLSAVPEPLQFMKREKNELLPNPALLLFFTFVVVRLDGAVASVPTCRGSTTASAYSTAAVAVQCLARQSPPSFRSLLVAEEILQFRFDDRPARARAQQPPAKPKPTSVCAAMCAAAQRVYYSITDVNTPNVVGDEWPQSVPHQYRGVGRTAAISRPLLLVLATRHSRRSN
jgi:hypothetical protein